MEENNLLHLSNVNWMDIFNRYLDGVWEKDFFLEDEFAK